MPLIFALSDADIVASRSLCVGEQGENGYDMPEIAACLASRFALLFPKFIVSRQQLKEEGQSLFQASVTTCNIKYDTLVVCPSYNRTSYHFHIWRRL